jgi:hypothetical protein
MDLDLVHLVRRALEDHLPDVVEALQPRLVRPVRARHRNDVPSEIISSFFFIKKKQQKAYRYLGSGKLWSHFSHRHLSPISVTFLLQSGVWHAGYHSESGFMNTTVARVEK